jgi:hypothetical protein
MSSSEPTADVANRMSPMAVGTLVVAAVCTTLLIVDAIADSAAGDAWPLPREIGAMFRVGASVGWVVFVLARVRDGLIDSMNRAHSDTREQEAKNHAETREQIMAVKDEVAAARKQGEQLRDLFNALALHIDAFGETKETDGRIAAMRDIAPKTNGVAPPRPLRPAGPVSN